MSKGPAVTRLSIAWDGQPITLKVDDSASMAQTPNGSVVVGYWNVSKSNNAGTLVETVAGHLPVPLDVPAGLKQPSLLVDNFGGNDLTLTNASEHKDTPITVVAVGPGIPGIRPGNWPVGTQMNLSTLQALAGTTSANYMRFRLVQSTAALTIVALIGGPLDASGNNAYLFAVNYSGTPPLVGFKKAVSENYLDFTFNWMGSSIYAANLSPQATPSATVSLTSL